MSGAPLVVVPDLGDERVRLRPWRPTDVDALVAAWADPAVIAGSSPPADRSPTAARRWIDGWDERRRAGVAMDLVIADPDDDRVLGEVGVADIDSERRAALVGWWVAGPERGRGVATAGVGRFTDWAVDGPFSALLARIAGDNHASLVVAERCGYELLRPATDHEPSVWARRA